MATGLRPRQAALEGAAALTPRQRQICLLAAAGKGNRAIAQELFLSVKTVETHLAAGYRKLGVNTRAGLAAVTRRPKFRVAPRLPDDAVATYGKCVINSRMIAAAFTVVLLGAGASDASAAYSAKVVGTSLQVNGDGASDSLVLELETPESDTLVLEVGGNRDLRFDRTTFTAVVVDAGAGDDRIAVSRANGPFLDEQLSLDGGSGDDVVAGSDGVDRVFGGSGDDTLDGNASADSVSLGDGNESSPGTCWTAVTACVVTVVRHVGLQWHRRARTVHRDRRGPRVRLTRNLGNVTMDLDSLESARVRTFGGATR